MAFHLQSGSHFNPRASRTTLSVIQLFQPVERSDPGANRSTLLLKRDPIKSLLRGLYGLALVCFLPSVLAAGETWQTALAQMPFPAEIRELNRTNCVDVMLHSF